MEKRIWSEQKDRVLAKDRKRKKGRTEWMSDSVCPFVIGADWFRLEDELQRELQLPRRAGVAGWESGAVGWGDESKGRASHRGNTPWLPKVRMVEEVEDLSPELDAQTLGNPGVLEDREIHVFEVWSGDDISAQAAKVEHAAARYRQRKD